MEHQIRRFLFFFLSQVENFVLYLECLRRGRVPRCGKTRRLRAWLNLGRQRRRYHLKYNVWRSISAAANFIPANDNDLLWWSICSFAYLFVPHASLPPVEKGRLRDPLGTFEKKRRWEEGKKTFKRWWVFLRGKSTGVLSNESLTGRTNVWHFLIDLITTITPSTNLHNKICKFWVSSRQIVFHFGQYEFCYGRDCVWIPKRPRLWDCASVAGVGSGRAGAGTGAGATDLSNRITTEL